ncbi:MAG: glycosyltransferase family 1 protein [Lachnospiraceae bacterium]
MKILQIPTGGLFLDGILSCIVEYMTAMDKSGMDIRILATNHAEGSIIRRIERSGCKVVSIPYRKTNIIKYFLELYKYITQEKIDIVHVHGSSAIMSIELLAAMLAGCKVRIAHSHNTTCENRKTDKMLRPLFNRAYTDAFACGQEAGKWMFLEKKFVFIPNGRKLQKYEYDSEKRIQYRNSLKIPGDALVIGHVGRFNTQKNHEYLIRIFDELYKKNKNAYLVLVGTGTTLDNIKKQVAELGLENCVIFTGAIDNASDYLSAFDVMLLPSLYEGLPLVVIEWQISGLPCIISDSITKECAITSLVKFESIKEQPVVWADDIEKLTIQDRNGNKNKIFDEIKAAGYDIATGAGILKKMYINLYENTLKL